MAEPYSAEIAHAITQFLDNDDWQYRPIDTDGRIEFGVSLQCKLYHADCMILVRKDGFLMHTDLNLRADDETSREAVAEFLSRVNAGFIHGNFECDMTTGLIRYRTSHFCGDNKIAITEEQIKHTIYLNLSMVERYGNGLIAVLLGYQTPEEAIAAIETDN